MQYSFSGVTFAAFITSNVLFFPSITRLRNVIILNSFNFTILEATEGYFSYCVACKLFVQWLRRLEDGSVNFIEGTLSLILYFVLEYTWEVHNFVLRKGKQSFATWVLYRHCICDGSLYKSEVHSLQTLLQETSSGWIKDTIVSVIVAPVATFKTRPWKISNSSEKRESESSHVWFQA